jgi:tetratricopeptide (TPR) repeat protein
VIGKHLGPYLLEKELGTGGMGSVWLATATEDAAGVKSGTSVAVKIVHPHLLERSGFFKRFMREAEIGRSVRHESVVRTFDVDALSVDGKQINFMVMEYVEGKTLRALLDELKTVPETLLREIARQVASGLAAIHAAGIVHRDLKPENVLITPDHVVKVMDLGVARLMEESVALTREGAFAGSLLYAAPEQFGGKPVGPSADLYSVGVMLYELASGENPFQRDGVGNVMAAHLKETPQRLSDRNSEVSPFFAEVVGTLLSKDPASRFDSSKTFFDLLQQGEKSSWWGERERVILKEEGHLPKIPVRRETALHGREESLALLRDAWESAKSGRGQMVLLEGEPGIGKSRLVDACLQTLKGEDAHVLYGSYPPSGGQGGLTDALAARFGRGGMEEALRPYLTVTPRLIPAFAALVQHESPPSGSEPLSSDGFHAVFVHLMKALAAEKPLLWIVDDLQFAPEGSRKVVLSLARALEGQRVLLLCAARPGIPEDEMAHFSRLPTFKRAGLTRLGARDVIALLKDALKSGVLAERLGGKIAFKSDGVPYFVFEMIRGLKEGNFIREQADGTYVETQVVSDIEVPSSVRDLIDARLKGLTRDERALVDVGAVQGMVFGPDLVARVLELKKMRVLQDLAEIERRTGLLRRDADGMRFDQNQIQEVLYKGLLPDLRDEYHAALADAFAEREGAVGRDAKDVLGQTAVFLANHYLCGSRPQAGVPYLVPAAEHLSTAYRDEDALALLERGLAASGLISGADRMEALMLAGPLRRNHGRPADGTAALEEAMAIADRAGDVRARARARDALAEHLIALGRFAAALEVAEAALPPAKEAGDSDVATSAERSVSICLSRLGRRTEARERFERALAVACAAGVAAQEAVASGDLSIVLHDLGHHAESQAHMEHSAKLHGKTGDRRAELHLNVSLGEAGRADGRYGAARERYRVALLLSRENGHRSTENFALHNLSESLLTLGDAAAAAEHLCAGARLAAEVGDRFIVGWGTRIRGDVESCRGESAEAERSYAAALEGARAISSAVEEAEALVGLGRLLARTGRSDEAAARVGAAREIALRSDDANTLALSATIRAALPGGDPAAAAKTLDGLGTRPWHVARMEARWWLWKATADRAHLAESWRLLQHLRDHAPEENRVTVIANVPLHREIAAAAKEAGL